MANIEQLPASELGKGNGGLDDPEFARRMFRKGTRFSNFCVETAVIEIDADAKAPTFLIARAALPGPVTVSSSKLYFPSDSHNHHFRPG